jgi:AcrR family transcriptional regulator
MPKLKPSTQAARRERILDAAELCFASAGFHGTTMQDICKKSGISPGALYVYFASKEALIAGIAERDRTKLQGQLEEVAEAPDLISALARLGEHYTVNEPHYKRVLLIEIGAEATRNPAVGQIFRSVDAACRESFVRLFERARAAGKINPTLDVRMLADVVHVIGDGLFWRRAVDPHFDAKAMMPAVTAMITMLLNPTVAPAANGEHPGRST